MIELDLRRGEEAILYSGGTPPTLTILPLPVRPEQMNDWGVKIN